MNEGSVSEYDLLFQHKSVLERFACAVGHFVVSVCVRVISDGIHKRHINFTIYHDAVVCSHINDLADNAAAVLAILIFDEFAFKAQRKFVDHRCIYRFCF